MMDANDSGGDTIFARLYTARFATSPGWYYVFVAALFVHASVGLAAFTLPEAALAPYRTTIINVLVASLVAMVVGVFFDTLRARERGWETETALWALGMIVFVGNVFLAFAYLYLRRKNT